MPKVPTGEVREASPRRGGRARVGTLLKTRDGRWQAQVTLPDGSRKRLKPFPKGTSEAMARDRAAYHAELAAKVNPKKPTPTKTPELPDTPMGRWVKAWLKDREARRYSGVRDSGTHYALHITPALGDKHVRTWGRDDMRKLAAALDAKVHAKELAWESAVNVWTTATKMASDAAESKQSHLRCRDDNPAPRRARSRLRRRRGRAVPLPKRVPAARDVREGSAQVTPSRRAGHDRPPFDAFNITKPVLSPGRLHH